MGSSEASAQFITGLTLLCNRLAERGFIVDSLQAEYGSFGSWRIEIRRQQERIIFDWDGRDSDLEIKARAKTPNSAGQFPLQVLEEKSFDRSRGDDPAAYVEQYLQTHELRP